MLIKCPHETSCTQQYHRPASGVRPLDNMNLKQNKYYFLWDKQTFGTVWYLTGGTSNNEPVQMNDQVIHLSRPVRSSCLLLHSPSCHRHRRNKHCWRLLRHVENDYHTTGSVCCHSVHTTNNCKWHQPNLLRLHLYHHDKILRCRCNHYSWDVYQPFLSPPMSTSCHW